MTDKELLPTLGKTPQKQKTNQQQQIISKNKERIEIIRPALKELGYKLLSDEFKDTSMNQTKKFVNWINIIMTMILSLEE